MNARRLISLAIAVALIAIAAVSAQTISISDSELDQRALGLPVDIKDQQTFIGLERDDHIERTVANSDRDPSRLQLTHDPRSNWLATANRAIMTLPQAW
jgi:hypothetical protein